jgi:ankyrin repeat protein
MGSLFCSYYIKNSLSKLRSSILENNIEEARKLLSMDKRLINIEIDSSGNTPLLLAIQSGSLSMFNLILNEFKADPNKFNTFTQFTPLHTLALTKLSINTNSTITTTYSRRSNESSIRLSNNRLNGSIISDSSQFPLEARFSNTSSYLPDSPIITNNNSNSIKSFDENILRHMVSSLIESGANVNALAQITPLSNVKIDYSKIKNIKTILNSITHITPMFGALLFSQNKVFIDELLNNPINSNKLDLNYQDKETGLNCLHIACGLARSDLVALLLDSNNNVCKLNLKSIIGTCLHCLALTCNEKDDIQVIQLITSHLKHQFIINNKDNKTKQQDLNEYLAEFVNETNEYKQTALMYASANNKQNLVKCLLDFKPEIHLTDQYGLTTFDYCKQNSCSQLLNSYLLIEKQHKQQKNKNKSNNNYNNNNNNNKNNNESNATSSDVTIELDDE